MFNERMKNNRKNRGKRLLVINGNHNLSKALGFLRSQRHNIVILQEYVTTTNTPDSTASNEIDVVIVDTTSNQKNGNVADRIRTMYPMRPVIAICNDNEKPEINISKGKRNLTMKKYADEILQALDYADSLLKYSISGFIISLNI